MTGDKTVNLLFMHDNTVKVFHLSFPTPSVTCCLGSRVTSAIMAWCSLGVEVEEEKEERFTNLPLL